jgi:hypothetical protein
MPAAIAAAVTLAVAVGARAEPLDDARKAVDASDYAAARPLVVQALHAGTASPDELAEIYKLTGIVESALGNASVATDAFSKWLSLDAKGSLPFGTSPKIMRPFTAAQQRAKKAGHVEAKAETEDDPPAVTLVVVNDPQKLVAGAKVYFRVDKGTEQTASADGTENIKLDLETGHRIDLRLHAVDQYGNRVVELGSKDVPIVITSSGKTKKLVDDQDRQLLLTKKHVEPPPPPPAPRPWYAQWWVWGAGTVVAGGVSGYFAWRTHEDIQDIRHLNENSLVHPWSDAQAVESRARRDLLVANIAGGAAGAFALGALILFFTRPSTAEQSHVAITPAHGGGTLVVGGHF